MYFGYQRFRYPVEMQCFVEDILLGFCRNRDSIQRHVKEVLELVYRHDLYL